MAYNFNQLGNRMPSIHYNGSFLPQLLASGGDFTLNSQLEEQQPDREREFRKQRTEQGRSQSTQSADVEEIVPTVEESNFNDLMFNGMLGMGQHMMMMPLMDPSLLGLQQFPILNAAQIAEGAGSSVSAVGDQPVKETIQCASCTLVPPNLNAPPPTTRERPAGCRTIFVGGLPENVTEPIIHEIFERCGEITTLRLSKKNFCHIRFVFEASVDSAIYLSGYRIKIGNQEPNTNASQNSGRLHVDYAQARDDQYEFECRQRQLQREMRHRERVEKDRLRPLSPPPIVHFTEHEATAVAERIKTDETFHKAVQVLITWLERGDCTKKNANTFYSMIQSTNSHVRRLLNDKTQYEDDLGKARGLYKKQMQSMLNQFTQIEKVFSAASHKKVWDQLTKAQRKNIDIWSKQSMEIRSVQLDEVQDNDEMEISDDDENYGSSSSKRTRIDNDNLKEENDSLRCQLHAYKNEVDLVKSDSDFFKSDTELKNKQIKALQEHARKLIEMNRDSEARINTLEAKLKEANVKELLLKTKIANRSQQNTLISEHPSHVNELPTSDSSIPDDENLQFEEAQIVSLLTAFLAIHPRGEEIEQILSYLHQFLPRVSVSTVLKTLKYHRRLFNEVEDSHRWIFCGFTNSLSSQTLSATESD